MIMGQATTHILSEHTASDISDSNLSAQGKNKTPYILVVTRNGHMAEPVMDYALDVADRYDAQFLPHT